MDFQENRQVSENSIQNQTVNPESTSAQQQMPAQDAAFSQQQTQAQDAAPLQHQTQVQDTAFSQQQTQIQDTAPLQQQTSQNGRPYTDSTGSSQPGGQPYQGRPPYGNGTPYPSAQQPYGSSQSAPPANGSPGQNRTPYGNSTPGGYGPNNRYNPYSSDRGGIQNGYPVNQHYYHPDMYRVPRQEPGGSLANAAMILGILAGIFGLIFPIYPAFALGSTAIVLALLSKGRRPGLLPKARTGIICATAGLILNIIVTAVTVVPVMTDPDLRKDFERQWEEIYGVPFDEMMDDIMENNGYPN